MWAGRGPLRHRGALARELGQELLEYGLGVANNPHLHATIGADLLRLDVDLNECGISRELSPEAEDPVEPRSNDHNNIGMMHHGAARGAEMQRVVVGNEPTAHRRRQEGQVQGLDELPELQGRLRPAYLLPNDEHGAFGAHEQLGSTLDLVRMAQGRGDCVVVGDPAHLCFFYCPLEHVGRQIQIDRARPSGACLPEDHGHVFRQARGAIHLHGHFGDALEHRHVVRLLEGPGTTPLLGTRASEDEQGQAVIVRHVGPGHTVGDSRSSGQHSDPHLVFDIPIGGNGKRGRLLVVDPMGRTPQCGAHPMMS